MTAVFWWWFVGGLILAGLEIVVPGALLLWFGLAAAVVGAIMWLFPELAWKYQVMLFAVLASLFAALARRYLRHHPLRSDRPLLNRRLAQYVGARGMLEAAIVNGVGRVRLGDTVWRCAGPDLPVGTAVQVVSADEAGLHVVPLPED